jgi:hypothetical protein
MSNEPGPSRWSAAEGDVGQKGRTQRLKPASRSPFRFPIGVDMIEGENYRQREGYDVIYLKDEETPRYQYTLAVSADRAAQVFERLCGLLPDEVRAVLEVPGPDDSAREICEVWMSGEVSAGQILEAFRKHALLFIHDGMVGFGAVSVDGLRELFMDEHKLIYYYAPDMEEADAMLADIGLRPLKVVRHFSELGHVHVSLSGKEAGEAYWEVAEELKKSLGLEWEESKEYT